MSWCPQEEKSFAAEPGKPTEIHENKLRHMFKGSWACFSAEKFARRRGFDSKVTAAHLQQ